VKIAALLGVLALLAAACGSSNDNAAGAKKSTATSSPPTTSVTNVVVSPTGLKVIPGSATGKSPCEKAAPTPASPGQVGAGAGGSEAVKTAAGVAAEEHGARGKVVQVPLDATDQKILNSQLGTATTVAKEYPTVQAALAAGYQQSTPYVPCIGAHYTNISLASSFDPAHPSELLYDGTKPDSKIVGLSYLVYHHDGPPPGFEGENDHWHQHNANGGLCLRGGFVVGSESTSNAECAKLGGHKTLLIDIWMLHAWIVPGFDCGWGVFSGECPGLGGRLCGNAYQSPDPQDTSECAKALNG
jgi:hypothetical protein